MSSYSATSHYALDDDFHGGIFSDPGDIIPGEGLVDQAGHIAGQAGASRASGLGATLMGSS